MAETARTWVRQPCLAEDAESKRARDFYYLYMEGEKRLALIYWLGGHVERPDEWIVGRPGVTNIHESYSSLTEAKREVEAEFGEPS